MSDRELEDEVRRLLSQGQSIQAIKYYREITGVNLAEAKSAIEAILAQEFGGAVPRASTSGWTSPNRDLNDEILELLAQDRKIEAIKRYREETGTGLAEAKAAVEAIQGGARIDVSQVVPPLPATPEQLLEEVLTLVRRNRYIWAIKRYREATGKQLKESKEAVDGLMRANGLEPPKSGCGPMLVVLLLVLFATGVGFYLAMN
jgi:ribosomal protein L7/L12